MSVRRYITIIQDPLGYPPPGELDPAPPEGPLPPVVRSVVLEADFERVEAEVERLREMLSAAPPGWQDPSTDLENVNAAYAAMREERDRAEAEVLRLREVLRNCKAAERVLGVLGILGVLADGRSGRVRSNVPTDSEVPGQRGLDADHLV